MEFTQLKLELFMPFYGDLSHFKYAIRSFVSQTDPDWALTIFDDQYPSEEPSQFIDELDDPRITFIRNEKNLGVSGNFQQCIDKATADFIAIVGCDDALLPNYVDRMKKILEENQGLAYIQPGVVVIDEHDVAYLPAADRVKLQLKNKFLPPSLASGEILATSLLKGCWTYFPSIVWNTQVLKEINFRPEFRVVLDLALQLEIVSSGGLLYIDDLPTFEYRRHRKSVSMESAHDGSRFVEEHSLFAEYSEIAHQLGWKRARRAAVLHITSRLNALTELPRALNSLNFEGAGRMVKHIFGK